MQIDDSTLEDSIRHPRDEFSRDSIRRHTKFFYRFFMHTNTCLLVTCVSSTVPLRGITTREISRAFQWDRRKPPLNGPGRKQGGRAAYFSMHFKRSSYAANLPRVASFELSIPIFCWLIETLRGISRRDHVYEIYYATYIFFPLMFQECIFKY